MAPRGRGGRPIPPCSRQPRPARRYWSGLRGRRRPALHREREQRQRLWGAPNRTPFVKDGINDAVVHGRADAVNPDHVGTKIAAHYLPSILAPARPSQCCFASCDAPTAPTTLIPLPMPRRSSPPASPRPTRSTPRWPPGLDAEARLIQRQAYAGLIWSKQFYYFDVGQWLDGDPGRTTATRRPQARPQRRLAPSQQRRRHLDARYLGVPLVRGLGPRLPLPPARPHRPRLRQTAARAPAARVVHAPERPDPGLRVGIRRRQSTGHRLGRLARLPDRRRVTRRAATASSWSASSTS